MCRVLLSTALASREGSIDRGVEPRQHGSHVVRTGTPVTLGLSWLSTEPAAAPLPQPLLLEAAQARPGVTTWLELTRSFWGPRAALEERASRQGTAGAVASAWLFSDPGAFTRSLVPGPSSGGKDIRGMGGHPTTRVSLQSLSWVARERSPAEAVSSLARRPRAGWKPSG